MCRDPQHSAGYTPPGLLLQHICAVGTVLPYIVILERACARFAAVLLLQARAIPGRAKPASDHLGCAARRARQAHALHPIGLLP